MRLLPLACAHITAAILLLQSICVIARNVTVFTQTNISAEYLTDPQLRLPFTSFIYIGPGENATEKPPATIRIAHLSDINSTTTSTSGSSSAAPISKRHFSRRSSVVRRSDDNTGFNVPYANGSSHYYGNGTSASSSPYPTASSHRYINSTWNSNSTVSEVSPPPLNGSAIPRNNASSIPNSPFTNVSSHSNSSDNSLEAAATILYIQHLANFTIPEAINSPNGIAWHSTFIKEINDTTLEPEQLMRTWGAGVLADIWEMVAREVDKRYWIPIADENVYILKLLERWGMTDSPGAQSFGKQYNSWRALTEGIDLVKNVKVNAMRIDMADTYTGRVYHNSLNDALQKGLNDIKNPSVPIRSVEFLGKAGNPNPLLTKALQPMDSAGSLHGASNLVPKGTTAVSASKVYETKVSFVRKGGIYSTLSVISEKAATYLNELVRVFATTICIIDFVNGNYVGGALGLVGVAFASILPMIFSNPVGVLFGTFIGILFFILPSVLKNDDDGKSRPHLNNTEIIQFNFFGDYKHTGNEKCAKEHPGCVASYGPGIIAMSWKWEWFDAVAFMIWANEGLTMTIPDMANAFGPPLSFDQSLGTNKSYVAQITCGNNIDTRLTTGRMNSKQWTHGNPNFCAHPTYHLNRSMIMLPRINRTAADVYNDIIDKDGGSCKIINNADNPVTVPNYGIVIQGLPVAIACGINSTAPGLNVMDGSAARANVTGTATGTPAISISTSSTSSSSSTSLPSNTATTTITSTGPDSGAKTISLPGPLASASALPSGWSPGSQSTDGRDGEGYVPPPAPKAFENPLNTTNAACFTTDTLTTPYCLPNGTYDKQAGGYGFNSVKTMSATFPQGASINVRFIEAMTTTWYTKSSTFNTNQTRNAKSSFAKAMYNMQALSFDVLIPDRPYPPMACLYTAKNFKGDVKCYGMGGGNLTDPAAATAQSVGILGGATVNLYPQYYGDTGGLAFTVSIGDTSSIPYGVNGSFDGNLKGMWVSNAIDYITK